MRYDTSLFIYKAKQVHGDRYNYDEVNYIDSKSKVAIECGIHGIFLQSPAKHLQSQGCPKCSYIKRGEKSTELFIKQSKEIHGDRYDYSKTEYHGSANNVLIGCRKHGYFSQRSAAHLLGSGCPVCAGSVKYTVDSYVKKAREVHGNKYSYEKVNYVNNKTNITITCKKHGYFVKQPLNHLQGYGCPSCEGKRLTLNKDVLLQIFHQMYDYTYEDFTYRNNQQLLTITCPTHGKFTRSIVRHLYDKLGCPACGKHVSYPHRRLLDFLSDESIQINARDIISPLELDIYLPEHKLAIEINGLYYHSTRFIKDKQYHYNKFKMCQEKGITLLQFFDSEILQKFEIVKDIISAKLGKLGTRIYARQCVIKDISSLDYKAFLENNHIQGMINSRVRLGLYYDNKLVMVAGFSKRPNFTIDRISSLTGVSVIGGAGKLVSHFLKSYNTPLTSFSLNRYSVGNVYKTLGFNHVSSTNYTLYYTDFKSLYPRNNFQKHRLLARYKNESPTKTAEEIAAKHGYYVIWGAGTKKWILE